MAIEYKADILQALRARGYTGYALMRGKTLHAMQLQAIRRRQPVSLKVVDALCSVLDCQPGDLIEHTEGRMDGEQE